MRTDYTQKGWKSRQNYAIINCILCATDTFVRMLEALGYDIELHYVKRDK